MVIREGGDGFVQGCAAREVANAEIGGGVHVRDAQVVRWIAGGDTPPVGGAWRP